MFSKSKIIRSRAFDFLEKEIDTYMNRGYIPQSDISYLHSNNGSPVYTILMALPKTSRDTEVIRKKKASAYSETLQIKVSTNINVFLKKEVGKKNWKAVSETKPLIECYGLTKDAAINKIRRLLTKKFKDEYEGEE